MHGSGLSHIVWSLHEQFYITNGYNVLSVDLPGHGNSDGPAIESIEKISDWVKSLMCAQFTEEEMQSGKAYKHLNGENVW